MNKKGNIEGVIFFFFIIFLLLLIGVALAFGSTAVNWVADEVVPELSNLGMIDNANLTEYAGYTISPLNSVIQSLTWLSGVLFFLGIIGIFGIAFAFRSSPNKWLMGFFFLLVILLVFFTIFISNMYEDFYSDSSDEVGSRLHEHTLISYGILYSPLIFTIIAFIGGIIMFSGRQDEEYY